MTALTQPRLSQYGTKGWLPNYEWTVTCPKCNTTYLSDVWGHVFCNGHTYNECPYCKVK